MATTLPRMNALGLIMLGVAEGVMLALGLMEGVMEGVALREAVRLVLALRLVLTLADMVIECDAPTVPETVVDRVGDADWLAVSLPLGVCVPLALSVVLPVELAVMLALIDGLGVLEAVIEEEAVSDAAEGDGVLEAVIVAVVEGVGGAM